MAKLMLMLWAKHCKNIFPSGYRYAHSVVQILYGFYSIRLLSDLDGSAARWWVENMPLSRVMKWQAQNSSTWCGLGSYPTDKIVLVGCKNICVHLFTRSYDAFTFKTSASNDDWRAPSNSFNGAYDRLLANMDMGKLLLPQILVFQWPKLELDETSIWSFLVPVYNSFMAIQFSRFNLLKCQTNKKF